jgi:hypothetical protein
MLASDPPVPLDEPERLLPAPEVEDPDDAVEAADVVEPVEEDAAVWSRWVFPAVLEPQPPLAEANMASVAPESNNLTAKRTVVMDWKRLREAALGRKRVRANHATACHASPHASPSPSRLNSAGGSPPRVLGEAG